VRLFRKVRWLIFALCLQASAGAQSTAPLVNEMQEFLSATEGTWEPVRDPNRPRKFLETLKFVPILDGRFETSQQILHNQEGKIVYRDFAVFGIDPDIHKLFLNAYNTDGSMDRTREVDSGPGRWVFLGTVFGSEQFRDYRYTMTQLEGGHLRILVELLKDGKYEKHSDVTYERTSKGSVPQID